MYTVYVITNTQNGMKYVGMTENHYLLRFFQHLSGIYLAEKGRPRASLLNKAMLEVGCDNVLSVFTVEAIGEYPTGRAAHKVELEKIRELNALDPNGYNTISPSNGCGFSHCKSKGRSEKRAASMKKYWEEHHDEHKEKVFTPAAREKMSVSQKERSKRDTPEEIEHRRKISESAKARWARYREEKAQQMEI